MAALAENIENSSSAFEKASGWLPAEREAWSFSSTLIPPEISKYSGNPYNYVLDRFPWGSGELANFEGPDDWQLKVLADIRDGLIDLDTAIRIAARSGHGVGKSALVGWLVCWAMDTMVDCKVVITANTEKQLKTKTWPEVGKWFRLGGLDDRFVMSNTTITSRVKGYDKTWRADLIPWTKNQSEAFAGLHNQGKRILLIFDEASGIDSIIWEVAEGALTDKDTEIIWVVLGNPTLVTGRFAQCWTIFKDIWKTYQIDSREVRISNKVEIAKWAETYGEDSDFFRPRVRGIPPKQGDNQFIPLDVATNSTTRELVKPESWEPLILGVDIARGGADFTRLTFRRGRDARSIPSTEINSRDTMRIVAAVAEATHRHKPDHVFVEGAGVGGGVVDRLVQLGYKVFEVVPGGSATRDPLKYLNKRAECWGYMRQWLQDGGCVPREGGLIAEFTAPEFDFKDRTSQLVLESKKDMKKRGIDSTDYADSLAMTFAEKCAHKDIHEYDSQVNKAKTNRSRFENWGD